MKKTYVLRHDRAYFAWYNKGQDVGLCAWLIQDYFGVDREWKAIRVTVSTEPFKGAVLVGVRNTSDSAYEKVYYTFETDVRTPTLPLFYDTACWLIKNVPGLTDRRKRIDLWVRITPVKGAGKL